MLLALPKCMTRRRIIEPGTVWALCRRTTRRYFLLNPDQARELEQCYWYCLGLAAKRFGVVVHAGCLMSTHSHEVVTDVRGKLPRFLQEFHRLLALSTKALRGWPGEVFDKRHNLTTTTSPRLASVIGVDDIRQWLAGKALK